MLSSSVDKEYFHATEDEQDVRDNFFVDSVIAQKNKANPSLYQEIDFKKGRIKNKIVGAEFYRIICQTLLQYVFRRYEFSKVNQIIVIMDACFTESKRNLILKSLKTYLKRNFNKPFDIYFHQSKADINCQIADYCGWAIYVKHDRNELRPFSEVKTKIKSEFQIFKSGLIEYYQYK